MATNNIPEIPFRAVHPTEIIKDEIQARGLSKKEMAARMGMKPSNLSRLLGGENITLPVAQKLEAALGIPADYWMRAQDSFVRDSKAIAARDEQEKLAASAEKLLSNVLNLPELYKRLNIDNGKFIQAKLEELKEKLGFRPIDIIEQGFFAGLNFNYKKSDKNEEDARNRATWLTLAYVSSRINKPSVTYKDGNAVLAAKAIANHVHNGELTESSIKGILNSYGIAYSVVKKLDKTPIDAASMKVEGFPSVITTHRYNDMSRLVFNVIHELGHITLHMGKTDAPFVSGDDYSSDSPVEKEANAFAQDILIDRKIWNKMMNDGSVKGLWPDNIVSELKLLSKEYGLDFNIVVWRWKFENHNYRLRGTKPVPIA